MSDEWIPKSLFRVVWYIIADQHTSSARSDRIAALATVRNFMTVPKKALKSAVTAKSVSIPDTCSLQIRVFDGTRNPFPAGTNVLYRVIDANEKEVVEQERKTGVLNCEFEFTDNFMDSYTVIVFSDGYRQAGFSPVKLSPLNNTILDLNAHPEGRTTQFRRRHLGLGQS
jgi:hypothetical protein